MVTLTWTELKHWQVAIPSKCASLNMIPCSESTIVRIHDLPPLPQPHPPTPHLPTALQNTSAPFVTVHLGTPSFFFFFFFLIGVLILLSEI
jgi:hypothetical protein